MTAKKHSSTNASTRTASNSRQVSVPPLATELSEDINPGHQTERVKRCLRNLNEAKKVQSASCSKLSKMRPTDPGFDVQAATLAEDTQKLIQARESYLNCARSI